MNPAHLRIGSAAENAQDAFADGRLGRRLNVAEVLKIVELRNRHSVDVAAIAYRFDICHRTVIDICKGRTHSKITGIEFVASKPGRPRESTITTVISHRGNSHKGAVHLTA